MPDEQEEDREFISKIGPLDVDWPRSLGYFGGIGAAVAFDLIAPELALFVAAVPIFKLLKRRHATKLEKAIAAILEGAAKPLGGDAEATVRPAEEDDDEDDDEEDAPVRRMHRKGSMSEQEFIDGEPVTDDHRGSTNAVERRSLVGRLHELARAHPRVSLLGAATIALFGGVEIAAAVLVGAGVAAFVRADPHADVHVRANGRSMGQRARQAAHSVREILIPRDAPERTWETP